MLSVNSHFSLLLHSNWGPSSMLGRMIQSEGSNPSHCPCGAGALGEKERPYLGIRRRYSVWV